MNSKAAEKDLNPLHFRIDGIGLSRTDPDGQGPLLTGVGEKDHGLHACGIHGESVDLQQEEFLFFPDPPA